MKAIHHRVEKKYLSLKEWLATARDLEVQDKEAAVQEYKQIAIAYPKNEKVYDRLMILFRQLKQPGNEIYWIKKAIDHFSSISTKSKRTKNTQAVKLSKSLAQSLGMLDKKGNPIYQPGPIGKWERRKTSLENRLGQG